MQRPGGQGTRQPAGVPERAWVMRWQYVLPAAVVLGILVIAVAIQPPATPAGGAEVDIVPSIVAGDPDVTPTASTSPTATTEAVSPTPLPGSATADAGATASMTAGAPSVTAAATSTAAPVPTPDVSDLEVARCGTIQENTVPLAVEQKLAEVAVRATNAAVYPINYLRCILLATGGSEAITLANAVAEAGRDGATHAALVDVWIANGNRDFAQLNLRDAQFAAGGQAFAALGVLAGRGEVVVASGQSRSMTLVATIGVAYGATTGPITVTIDAPLIGGEPSQGKYQLFLPTP